MRVRLLLGVVGASVVVTSIAAADPIGIQIRQATYSTDLSTRIRLFDADDYTLTTQTQLASAVPLHAALQGSTNTFARATADTFSVMAWTNAFPALALEEASTFANARAGSAIQFSPVTDADATIGIDWLGMNQAHFSSGFVRLVDLTASVLLWNYQWDYPFAGNIPFVAQQATLSIVQPLLASHLYGLTLHTETDANTDHQSMTMRVSGLESVPVPEPATILLLATGLTAAAWRRVRKGARHGSLSDPTTEAI